MKPETITDIQGQVLALFDDLCAKGFVDPGLRERHGLGLREMFKHARLPEQRHAIAALFAWVEAHDARRDGRERTLAASPLSERDGVISQWDGVTEQMRDSDKETRDEVAVAQQLLLAVGRTLKASVTPVSATLMPVGQEQRPGVAAMSNTSAAAAARAIANAITPTDALPTVDATGSHVGSLTEAVMGMTAALVHIAQAIEAHGQRDA